MSDQVEVENSIKQSLSQKARDVIKDFQTDPKLNGTGEKRAQILQKWNQLIEQVDDTLPTRDQLLEFIDRRTNINSSQTPEAQAFPIFTFGDDLKSFFVVCTSLMGEGSEKTIVHELEHALIYAEYNIPVEYLLMLGRNDDGTFAVAPSVTPHFPKDMPLPIVHRISREATEVVTQKSQGDRRLLDSIEKLAH